MILNAIMLEIYVGEIMLLGKSISTFIYVHLISDTSKRIIGTHILP